MSETFGSHIRTPKDVVLEDIKKLGVSSIFTGMVHNIFQISKVFIEGGMVGWIIMKNLLGNMIRYTGTESGKKKTSS